MKIFLVTSLFLTISLTAIGQKINIAGSVSDESGSPVIGAVVTINHSNMDESTITDRAGNFTMVLEDINESILSISSLGYQTFTKSLTEQDISQKIMIQLTVAAIQLQSVEIVGRRRQDYNSEYSFSGSKVAILNKELPQAISSVTKEFMNDRQAFQLVDAVKVVSNVAATGIYNHYNIRGLTQGDDGQVINGLRTRQYYFLQPITSHIERVEVIKGPSSVTFSSSDPGGTVNMVTKKPLKEKKGEFSLSAGSFATMRAAIDFTGPLNEEKTLLYRINAAFQEAKSFRDVVNNNSFFDYPLIKLCA